MTAPDEHVEHEITEKGKAVVEMGLSVRQAYEIEHPEEET